MPMVDVSVRLRSYIFVPIYCQGHRTWSRSLSTLCGSLNLTWSTLVSCDYRLNFTGIRNHGVLTPLKLEDLVRFKFVCKTVKKINKYRLLKMKVFVMEAPVIRCCIWTSPRNPSKPLCSIRGIRCAWTVPLTPLVSISAMFPFPGLCDIRTTLDAINSCT